MIHIDDNAILEIEKDKITLTRTINDDAVKLYAQQARNHEQSFGGFGAAKWKEVAFLPIEVLNALGERGVAILNDPNELRKFLMEHPEYKTTRGTL